jgi:acetate kinase
VNILVINSGSSTIKYRLIDMPGERRIAAGLIERIGEEQASLMQRRDEGREHGVQVAAADHRSALAEVSALLSRAGVLENTSGLAGIGHRVVHRAERFTAPEIIDAAVPDELKVLAQLAREMFCYRLRKDIGAYFAVLGGLDGLVFTAGIGEDSCRVRAGACAGLGGLVIPTDEELEIARGPAGVHRRPRPTRRWSRIGGFVINSGEKTAV